MKIEIDLGSLSDDEHYHLAKGLEALEHPNLSCKRAIAELKRLSNESYSKFCSKHPYYWC
jgi:hypothetical protein